MTPSIPSVQSTSPATVAADFAVMASKWRKINDLREGAEAVRAGGERYLPRYARENRQDYSARLAAAPFVNIFGDILANLGARPFSDKAQLLTATSSPALLAFSEDVDGEGSNLHQFAQRVFHTGLAFGLTYILVDFTKLPDDARTIADEKRYGARPTFTEILPTQMIAARTQTIGGVEQFSHVRFSRTQVVDDGYAEKSVEQIVEFNRTQLENKSWSKPTWKVHEKKAGAVGASEWEVVEEGVFGIERIPLVAFVPGRRKGRSWQVSLPLGDAADLQIEHYQAESGLKHIKVLCQFPMVAALGVSPPTEGAPITVGPSAVLFAPPSSEGHHGEFKILEPTGASVKVLADDIDRLERQLREIGRQPLTANSGNLTVVTTQFAAAKGNSAIEAWALIFKDCLEQAFIFAAEWLGDTKSVPEVQLHLDLSVDLTGADFDGVLSMQKAGAISRKTLRAEAKRRGLLSPDFDEEAEDEQLAMEGGEPDTEEDIQAAVTPFKRRA